MLLRHSLIFYLVIFLLPGCKNGDLQTIAMVDGEPISFADIEKTAAKELSHQREVLYRLQQQKLDEYIGALLLTKEAVRRKVSVTTLLEDEVTSKILDVTDDEVAAFYNIQKTGLSGDVEKLREQIRGHLRQQKLQSQKALYFKSLKSKAVVLTYLAPPPVLRLHVPITGSPIKGLDNARVTIVKFEDFQCPFCKQAQPILGEILSRYNGKIRLIHKDLPLDSIHPQARQAAEAARCAGDEGKYWAYHDKLYASSPKVAIAELKMHAREIGLHQESFEKCLSTGKYKALVQKDLNDGSGLGLTGTPAFFINGREITGAQPIEAFAAIIDEELARVH